MKKKRYNLFSCWPSEPCGPVSCAAFFSGHTPSVELGFKGMGLSVSSRSHTAQGVGVLRAQARGKNEVGRRPKKKDANEGKMIKRKMKNKVFGEIGNSNE